MKTKNSTFVSTKRQAILRLVKVLGWVIGLPLLIHICARTAGLYIYELMAGSLSGNAARDFVNYAPDGFDEAFMIHAISLFLLTILFAIIYIALPETYRYVTQQPQQKSENR